MAGCCEPQGSVRLSCPECGNQGRPVRRITLESLLKDPARIQPVAYWFCTNPACRVVYFTEASTSLFHKGDLKVRVGIKEIEDPIPLCYCFGWDRKRIREEIKTTGRSTAIAAITREVKAGNCFCERSNPQGTCCLGNISQAVKEEMKRGVSQRKFM